MKPIAVVATHPIQYQAPLYRYLSRRGVPIRVLFLSDHGLEERFDVEFGRSIAWDIPLVEGYPHEFLHNVRRVSAAEHFFGLVNPGLLARLRGSEFSAVIVHGYRNLSMLMAIGRARLGRVPVLYRSESSRPPGGNAQRRLVSLAFRSLVSGCLSIGSLNDEFYSSIGVPSGRRFMVPYSVDNERFQEAAAAISKEDARRELGLRRDGQVVLYAGKLVPWKQPDLLLRAFATVNLPNTQLVFAGDGEMQPALRRWADVHLPGRVTFLGFMNQSRIPLAYRSADLLVLPSRHEPWGLVVNEVMNFAVPVVVSDRVGCAPDLVRPGSTGEIFETDDVSSLERCLKTLLDDPVRLRQMGTAALARISAWGFPQAEAGIRAAVASVAAGR